MCRALSELRGLDVNLEKLLMEESFTGKYEGPVYIEGIADSYFAVSCALFSKNNKPPSYKVALPEAQAEISHFGEYEGGFEPNSAAK